MTVSFEVKNNVVIAKLCRYAAKNALNLDMMNDLIQPLKEFDRDPSIGCFVISSNDSVFCAGADIKEMSEFSCHAIGELDYFSDWQEFTQLRTPSIAVVNGLALGGGFELALMCDMLYASEQAKFGLPEINLGVIPGMGGTQRLTKIIGKHKAMDMILTGRVLDASEAEQIGLVSRIFPHDELLTETVTIAEKIAQFGRSSIRAAKETINQSQEMNLKDGLLFERRAFQALFSTHDQSEGMQAFIEKRAPKFRGN